MRATKCMLLSVLLAAIGGCGGDDESLDEGRVAVVDMIVGMGGQAVEFDRGCLEDSVGQLSDSDVEALVATNGEEEVELSQEGQEIMDRIVLCVDREALADETSARMEADGAEVDEACMRELFAGLSDDEMLTVFPIGEGSSESMRAKMEACTSGG